jgi:putative transcriptional regulator
LAAPAEKITALDVFEAIEGTAPAFTCQDIRRHGLGAATPEECRRKCIIHTLVDSADAAWRSELAKKAIADLVSVLPSTLKHRTATILSDAASGANREPGKPGR